MRHLEVLQDFKMEIEHKSHPLALLVFGSVAKGTNHDNSDIDLLVIYKSYLDQFKFETTHFQGIKIGMSNLDYEYYRDTIINKPFTRYILTTAQVIFDKTGKMQLWINVIKRYFQENPDIQSEWERLNEVYEEEKRKYGAGRTNIFDVYKELEKKFKGRILQEPLD